MITPYDKGAMGEIEKAIQTSDLGLNPMNDGKLIRIPIPELNEERRKDLVRHIRKTAEEFRVSIRNHRREANDKFKQLHKDKKLTEAMNRDVWVLQIVADKIVLVKAAHGHADDPDAF